MKILKILFKDPQFILIFFLLGILFAVEIFVVVIAYPFELIQYGITWTIKQLLKLIK